MFAYDYPLLGPLDHAVVLRVVRLDHVAVQNDRQHLPQPRPRRVGQYVWITFVIVSPFLGVFVYLIARATR